MNLKNFNLVQFPRLDIAILVDSQALGVHLFCLRCTECISYTSRSWINAEELEHMVKYYTYKHREIYSGVPSEIDATQEDNQENNRMRTIRFAGRK